MAYLEVRNLSKKYNTSSDYVLKRLNLSIEKGEFVTLLGKSGCGKTTLLRVICGFETHNKGEIWLKDRIISSPTIWIPPEKRNIGIVFQDYALFPNMTAWDNIAFALGKDKNKVSETDKIMKIMSLYDIRNHYPHQLSGGQQQRVALARALIRKPDVLLMDEPFSNLDLEIREMVRDETLKILKDIGATVVFVTHDQMEALSISDKIAILEEGKIQQIGSPFEIYNHPKNMFVAEFIGRVNMLEGTVVDSYALSTVLGSVVSKEAIPYKEGAKIKFMIRPEDIRLKKDGKFTGTVIKTNYQGSLYDALIAVYIPYHEPIYIRILAPGSMNIKPGDRLSFDMNVKSKHHMFLVN
ncbi:MAG: ABC transporter ATP-binding protein [Lutispora sp.]|jgi:iron(III) transport system ATP-binding protein|uniref:ABC transporter ATP-binding protein n=1 Tax=Lutispora sp. TaxID=2828727 RepID=UPI00356296F0